MKKCYLIDDDKIFNLISTKMIERSGWNVEVQVYNNAELALAEIKSNLNSKENLPFVILLDVRMPDMDGLKFLESISEFSKEFISELKVFMLSSSLDERDMKAAYQFPMVKGFLNKPLTVNDLNEIVNSL